MLPRSRRRCCRCFTNSNPTAKLRRRKCKQGVWGRRDQRRRGNRPTKRPRSQQELAAPFSSAPPAWTPAVEQADAAGAKAYLGDVPAASPAHSSGKQHCFPSAFTPLIYLHGPDLLFLPSLLVLAASRRRGAVKTQPIPDTSGSVRLEFSASGLFACISFSGQPRNGRPLCQGTRKRGPGVPFLHVHLPRDPPETGKCDTNKPIVQMRLLRLLVLNDLRTRSRCRQMLGPHRKRVHIMAAADAHTCPQGQQLSGTGCFRPFSAVNQPPPNIKYGIRILSPL